MNDKQRLAIEAEELRNVRVLCVGDVMLDRYVYGDVERMSPEAPIPVLRVREERSMLGGAGNVARNLAALGAYVSFVAVIGPDEAGTEIASMLGALPQMEARLVTEESRRSTVKQRYVAMNQHVMRADRETTTALSHARQQELIGNIRALLPGVQVLVLSDYGKGALTADVCLSAIEEAHRLNIPVVVDPKGRNYANYRGADVITPNRKELSEISGLVLDSDAKIISAARQLIQQYSFGAVLVTRSHEGMSVVEGNGSITHLAAEAREVFDVSGAGDTVVSTLSTGLALGLSLVDAATLANAAAGLVVGKVGTAVVYRDELAAKMRKRTLTSIDEKVATWSGAQERVAGWRRRGLRVGFTNGCFDLLHPGHLALMERAHGLCDRLIVGLNSDASVTRLKGPARPIQPEITRSTVLASMSNVDLVVVFEEDTPRQLIEFLCPDVLIKGGDYTVDTIVGADFVLSHGGRVEIIDLVPGFSTTKIVEKMIG